MDYIDREGHRIKKTTSQDKFLKFVYTHTATRVLMRPLLLPAVSRLGGKLLNTKVSAVFAGLFARTHGIDLNKYEKQSAEKRGSGQIPLILDELTECIPADRNSETLVEDMVIKETLDRFLENLSADARKIFVRRYWYMSSVKEIAEEVWGK